MHGKVDLRRLGTIQESLQRDFAMPKDGFNRLVPTHGEVGLRRLNHAHESLQRDFAMPKDGFNR